MSGWKDLDKLSKSELHEIESIIKSLKHSDAVEIKSTAIQQYVNNASRHGEVFATQCYIAALSMFLNRNGYQLVKKEDDNGK